MALDLLEQERRELLGVNPRSRRRISRRWPFVRLKAVAVPSGLAAA
ncbi:MAG: hypothetical protein ACLQU9_14560 [Acidimicrobiales bacterium]|jgi:hypothetical protein